MFRCFPSISHPCAARWLLLGLVAFWSSDAQAEHWAFAPIQRPTLPSVSKADWVRNPIDRFVLARLEKEGLEPAPAAAPEALVRRASFGLVGLPPSADERHDFVSHFDEASYRAWIEQRLGSIPYGEHWARHWMDVARYADSAGFELDYLFLHGWRYRDALIKSFAENKRMDRFIQEQIAGDQLWPQDAGAVDGALFLTVGPMRFEGGIKRNKEQQNAWLTDLADTTGSAFLGLTMGCTRCHDHKFDPLTQNDYYGMQAIFAESELKEEREGKGGGNGDTRPSFIQVVPRSEPAAVQVLRRGEVDLPIREALPSLPAALPKGGPVEGKARRVALAQWLTSAQNPLTARVLVNRVWQWHFGQGLVRTANDFGKQGEAPSHPELLDWLASELIASGWDLRHLQHLILESATYRQSSARSAKAMARDPENRLLAGFSRRRLQAEELRDGMLAVAGELNGKSFGPPVVPPVEPWALAALRNQNWKPTTDTRELTRRSIYLVVRRSIKLPFFDAFNIPDTINSCAGRESTVVASQALALLNSDEALTHAKAFADRLWRESQGDTQQAVRQAWILLFSREPSGQEIEQAQSFLAQRAPESAWVEWCLALLNTNEFAYVD